MLTAVYLIKDCPLPFYITKLPMNFCLEKFLLIHTLGHLVFYALLQPLVLSLSNSLLELENVFSLVIPTMSRVTSFLIFYLTPFLSLDMLFFMKRFFPFFVTEAASSSSFLIPLPSMSPIPSYFYDNPSQPSSIPSTSSHTISNATIIDIHHDIDEDLPQDLPKAPDEILVPNSHLRRSTRTSKPPSYLQAYQLQ